MASSSTTSTQTMEATKRIQQHMNADHADSLIRFLEHFHDLSSSAARNARLTEITLSSLRITTASPRSHASIDNTYTIVLSPPMKSFSEARERFVALDAECTRALGRSDITVKRYVPPNKPFHLVVIIACISAFVLYHRRAYLDPVTAPAFMKRNLIDKVPRAFAFFYTIQPMVFYPMIAAHVLETWWMDRSRLRVHSVPRGSRLWWTWMAMTFTEGFCNFHRLDEYVAQERKRKEKKH